MNTIYTKNSEEFEFIKCSEVKKVEEALSYWMAITQRPIEWDFDLSGHFSRFDKKDIRDGLAKVTTVGGLKAGILAIKNDKNRVSSYFVWSYQVSENWKAIKGNTDADNCVRNFPTFDVKELRDDYSKFCLANKLESELNKTEIKAKKIKI